MELFHFQTLSRVELIELCEHLGSLLAKGISITQALELHIQGAHKTKQKLIQPIINDIMAGTSFGKSIVKHLNFPTHINALIAAGESSGKMSATLLSSAMLMKKHEEQKKAIIKTLQKPVMTFAACLFIFIIAALFVAPSLVQLFSTLNAPTPKALKFLLIIGNQWAMIMSGLSVVLVTGSLLNHKFKIYQKIDPLGISAHQAIASLCGSAALLISHGIPLLETLKVMTAESSGSIKTALESAITLLLEGQPLSVACQQLKKSGFDDQDITTLMFAHQAESIAQGFELISEHHQKQLSKRLSRIELVAAPLLMLIIGAIVTLMIMSLYKPLLSVGSLIKMG